MVFLFNTRQSTSTEGKAIILHFFALIILFAGIQNPLSASISTDSIPYGITSPTGSFNIDDSATFTVWAGTQTEALSSIVGFDLTFTLTEDAVFPDNLDLDFSNSWLADGDDMSVTIELDSEEKTIRITGQRTSGSKDGAGELFAFTLVSASNQVNAASLLDGEGSGIIITIDDVILRKAAPKVNDRIDVNVFPNPTAGKVIVSSNNDKVKSLLIINAQGQQVASVKQTAINLRQLEIPSGKYWIKVILQSGKFIYKPILFTR